MNSDTIETKELTQTVISPDAMLAHWQGHRSLSRRTIEAFPEQELFSFSIGGMRPYSELVMEMIQISGAGLPGIVTSQWSSFGEIEDKYNKSKPITKEQLLKLWDDTTATINDYWAQIPPGKFEESILAFNLYEGTVYSQIFYFVDNEIHHRGQGFVYLRALGIKPPDFWER